MRISHHTLGWTGALAVAALVLAPVSASAEPNKCNKELAKWAAKGATDTQKEIQKCVDGIQKELDKEAASPGKGKVDKAADKCQKSMDKTGVTNVSDTKSKLGKALSKINDAVTKGKCTSADLVAAGWPNGSSDIAGRILLASAAGEAWNEQTRAAASSVANMITAADAVGEAGGCPSCQVFVKTTLGAGNANGPCPRRTCTLVGSSGINTVAFGIPGIPVTLAGDLAVNVCDLPGVYPDTVVLASSANSGNQATIPGGVTVCIDAARQVGAIATTGASSATPFSTVGCADHDLTVDACAGGTCTTNTTGVPSVTCYDATPVAAVAGGGSLALTQQLTVHVGGGGAGPDGTLCTNDDTVAPSAPTTTVLTTDVATATINDGGTGGSAGAINLATTVTGSTFSLPVAFSGGKLVGAFSAIDDDGSGIGDSVTDITFECL